MRPEDVERFTIKGGALLGKETNPSDAEKGAHKTALSQLEAMREKQVSPESQTAQPQEVLPDGANRTVEKEQGLAPTGVAERKSEAELKAEAQANASKNKDQENERALEPSAASRTARRTAFVSFGDRSCVICSLQ